MPDPFSTALGALFRGPGSVEAVYTPHGLPPLADPIRVIRDQPTVNSAFGSAQVLVDTNSFQIQKADVSTPLRGDRLTINGVDYVLSEGARLDVEGLTWTCPAELA